MSEPRKIRIHPDEWPVAEHLFREAAAEYIKADDEYSTLEDMQKDLLAQVMTRVEKEFSGDKVSESKLERLARCDAEWIAYKEGLNAARQVKGEKKARYVQADRYWQTLQSALGYKKAEMMKLNG